MAGTIIDGQPVNAAVTNTSKLDRQGDDTAFGIITLNNAQTASGATVTNLQEAINNVWQDKKLFVYVKNAGFVTWNGSTLTLDDDLVIESKDQGISNSVAVAYSPITIAANASLYVTLNRYATGLVVPFTNTTLPKGKDVFRICTRVGNDLIFADNTYVASGQSVRIGASSSGGGGAQLKVTLYDPVSTSLPTGTSAIIDGVTITNGMTVLFPNLSVGANRMYQVSGVGTSLVWTTLAVFGTGSADPSDGDSVRILQGTTFGDQLAIFNGTIFIINDRLRVFNGVDYFEQSGIISATLADNTTGNVFTVGATGSENHIVDYSITRGSSWALGQLFIKTDGTTAEISDISGALNGAPGVVFSADISLGNLRLRFTTDSQGVAAAMKYSTKRWSNSSGGPAGLPSYSVGSSPVAAAGSNTQVQYNSGGLLGASSNFTFDSLTKILQIGGYEIVAPQTGTLVDNTATPTPIVTMNATTYPQCIIDFSVTRNGSRRAGTIVLVSDGIDTSISIIDADSPTVPTGIIFTADFSAGLMRLLYTTSSTGFNATLKYTLRRWG